ncbi:MAG: hypothetical protein ACTSXJ_00415 [Candidatus Baldrarchaeia archaeon]
MGIKGAIAWRFLAKKMNAMEIRYSLLGIVEYLIQTYKEPEKVYSELKKIFKRAGEIVYLKYLQATRRFARSIEDLIPTYNLGFKLFTGRSFDDIRMEREGKDIYITYTIYDCPICKGLSVPIPVPICVFFASVFEWIEEQRLQDWNAEFVKCDETKCRVKGDECCEFRAHIRLR